MENYTDVEIERMKQYEQRTGERIIYTFEERCSSYRTIDRNTLKRATLRIRNAINVRTLDDNDCFDGPDDGWKLKVLEENLKAIERVLVE